MSILKFVCGPVAVAVLMSVSLHADARKPVVRLGEVSTSVNRARVDLKEALRAEVGRQLAGMDFKSSKTRESFILSARLVQLDTQAEKNMTRSTCKVSAMLRKQGSGALFASVQAKASAEGMRSAVEDNELEAMRAAVHMALGRIPSAIE